MNICFVTFSTWCGSNLVASEAKKPSRKPASTKTYTWEVRTEIPVGKACPSQAQRFDDIAYQIGGDGGYVCFTCDYVDSTPLLVVASQSRCPNDIKCKNGKCE